MSFNRKISTLWQQVFKPRTAAPAAAPAPLSYGVIVDGKAYDDAGTISPVFVAQATPVAEKIVEILKQQGLQDDALQVTMGALSTAADHYGVRFNATPAIAQAVADALPNHVVIRSDCRVVCTTAKDKPRRNCEFD